MLFQPVTYVLNDRALLPTPVMVELPIILFRNQFGQPLLRNAKIGTSLTHSIESLPNQIAV